MNFTKVKSIIIVCLVVVNIILGAFCLDISYEKSYISSDLAILAESNLESLGIDVDFDSDLRKRYDIPVYSFEKTEKDVVPEFFRNVTEKFYGVSVQGSEYVTTPGGYSVSVKNSDGVLLGTASLSENMKVKCTREGLLDNTDEEELSKHSLLCDFESTEDKKAEKIAENFIRSALGNSGTDYKLRCTKKYKDGTLVCFDEVLSGVSVCYLYANVYVKKGEILYFYANFYNGNKEKAYNAELIDSVNALYSLYDILSQKNDEKSDITIEKMNMIYKLFEYEEGSFYAVPSWHIQYRDDNGNTYSTFFDAIIGQNEIIFG